MAFSCPSMPLLVLGHMYHFKKDHLWEYGSEDSIITSELHWDKGGMFIIIIYICHLVWLWFSSRFHEYFSPEIAQVADWRCINPLYAGLEIYLLSFCWLLYSQVIRTKSHLWDNPLHFSQKASKCHKWLLHPTCNCSQGFKRYLDSQERVNHRLF